VLKTLVGLNTCKYWARPTTISTECFPAPNISIRKFSDKRQIFWKFSDSTKFGVGRRAVALHPFLRRRLNLYSRVVQICKWFAFTDISLVCYLIPLLLFSRFVCWWWGYNNKKAQLTQTGTRNSDACMKTHCEPI